MSDPPVVKVSETCWCGTEVSVEGVGWDVAEAHVTSWRSEHRHRSAREADHVGFASAGFAHNHGQAAAKANPWSAT